MFTFPTKNAAQGEKTLKKAGDQTPAIWIWWVLICCLAIITLERWHTFREPLERDISFYAVVAHEIVSGKKLYSEVWANQPPGIHMTYAAAEMVAGYGRSSIFLLNVVGGIVVLLGVFFAGSRAGFGRKAGLWAAVFWTIVSGSLATEANQPNTELFMNAFCVWGFGIFLSVDRLTLGWRKAVLAGICFAAATLYKHIIILVPVFLCIVYLFSSKSQRRHRTYESILIGGVITTIWLLFFAWLFWAGRLEAFWESTVIYNRAFTGNMAENLISSWKPWNLFPPALYPSNPLTVLGLFGCFTALRKRMRCVPWLFLLAFVAGTQIAIGLPGRFYPHYYQLWLPALVLAASWTVASLGKLQKRMGMSLALILFAIQVPQYLKTPAEWSEQKYGNIFVDAYETSSKVNRVLNPGETFYQLGSEPEMYFATGRRPPTGVLFDYPLFTGPKASAVADGVVKDLERERPELLVLQTGTYQTMGKTHPLCEWLLAHYAPAPELDSRYSPFRIYLRKGGRIHLGQP